MKCIHIYTFCVCIKHLPLARRFDHFVGRYTFDRFLSSFHHPISISYLLSKRQLCDVGTTYLIINFDHVCIEKLHALLCYAEKLAYVF